MHVSEHSIRAIRSMGCQKIVWSSSGSHLSTTVIINIFFNVIHWSSRVINLSSRLGLSNGPSVITSTFDRMLFMLAPFPPRIAISNAGCSS